MILAVSVGCDNKKPLLQSHKKTDSEPTKKDKTIKTNDPIFYSGSSFGKYLQILSKQGLFDEMVEFTDNESRIIFGDTIIKDFYRNIDFSFDMKLKSLSIEGKVTWLNYEALVNITKKTFRFPVVIENNSCRLKFSLFQTSLKNIQ